VIVGLVRQNVPSSMNVMIGRCLEFNQCAPWWLGSNKKTRMIGIPYGLDITNSPFEGASWSWTLSSNNSSPCGRLENLANIVDLLNFPTCPPMNIIGNEALWLSFICQLEW
jgi:hypothetical protein